MKPQLEIVRSRRQLRTFITFPEKLYKNEPNWVPALIGDEFDTLDPKKNAAFEYCESRYWLARDAKGKVVGRVAGIINHNANERWHKKSVRFGWIDFVEDIDVAAALLEAVEQWGREKGMTECGGPWGFTDMDKEGLMVEGFENLSPFTCIYNFPYYPEFLERLGYSKSVDWTQKIIDIPPQLPPMLQYTDLVEKKFGLRVVREKNLRTMVKKYGMAIFQTYNESFAPLYEFAPLSDEQIRRYLKTYGAILDLDFVCVVADAQGKMVGFGFCVPTLSKAVKKCGGRLFPFGFINVLHALKKNDTIEALLIGVLPEYQGKGATALIFKYLHSNCIKRGITKMLANPQLETNYKAQNIWAGYETHPYMRRRAYVKEI